MVKKLFFIFSLVLMIFPARALAQPADEEMLEGKVIGSVKEDVIIRDGQQFLYQELKVKITKGSLEGKEIIIESGNLPLVGQPKYRVGDRVLINFSHDFEGNEVFLITDYVRRLPLAVLFLVFVFLAVLVGQWRGAASLLGLVISFLVIFSLVLPWIHQGKDPVLVSILGSVLIIPVTFYLSHGLNLKTTMAIAGTLGALMVTGFLAKFFIDWAHLTGYASEEAGFLQTARPGVVNIRGLILAGIIIGALGILDDITVAQAAVVQQLKAANPRMKMKTLFWRAMRVGQDHIASMVNTLVLVYTGAALPLLLLFIDSPRPFGEVINYELIAEEIIRMLVGSIGLITAVPLTTFLAARFLNHKAS
jgi:uncharacterized membrane protein